MKKPASVDDYLKACTPSQRRVLSALRRTIRSAVPEAVESVSYGVPYYRVPGRGFVTAFAARRQKGDLSLYATPSMAKKFARELKRWDVSGGTVHFPPSRPLPASLVRRIVKARLALSDAKSDDRRLSR